VVPQPRLEKNSRKYLRDPRLVRRDDGGADLHVIECDETGEAHVVIVLDRDGIVTAGEEQRASGSAILGLTHDTRAPAVATDHTSEYEARDGTWSVRLEREGPTTRVIAQGPSEAPVLVWQANAIAAAPSIASCADGAWVAFHHDLREDEHVPDVTKWIAVRFVDSAGRVFEPSAPMRDRDRDREGEEQGFEFPSLVVGHDGALTIYGRGSHAFYRQDLDASGFGPRVALGSNEGWGCRGRRISACRLTNDEHVLTARREKSGIAIEREDAPRGGRPALSPAHIEYVSGPRRDVKRRPRAHDFAERWGRMTLFGDIHQHSAHSDGCGAADEPYLRARYGYEDDFVALTDHESFLGKRISRGEWSYLERVADEHDDPGRFATLIAYEWTGQRYPGPGHKVVYMPRAGLPIVSRDDVPDGAELVRRVKELSGFAVPHHVGWTGANEDAHDEVGQPVWEICSCHGCYLHWDHPLGARGDLRDQMIDEVLKRGHRFGFIACSDGHGLLWHHGVSRKRDPFRTGLTAVQARARTREAILEAIRERRCYATSGAPILLNVIAHEGFPMGSAIRVQGAIRVKAEAFGTDNIREISLVGPQGVIATRPGAGQGASIEADVAADFVYAKVVQDDGEMAWSSPVFFERN
jgi:hypothetical protein